MLPIFAEYARLSTGEMVVSDRDATEYSGALVMINLELAQEGRQYEPHMLCFPSAVTQISGLAGRRYSNDIHPII